MPWYLKIIAKILLSRLPFGYSFFSRLGLFRHGSMDSVAYVVEVFWTHLRRARERGLAAPFVGLEIGPGDSVASILLARAAGSTQTYLVDAGDFATRDMAVYRAVASSVQADAGTASPLPAFNDFDEMVQSCAGRYLVEGLRSLASIPSDSVDFVWSQAVLEHIPAAEFAEYMRELQRVLKPGGIMSHRVDLKDHLGGALNNLRFSQRVWESSLMSRSGFYTNRIRYPQMIELFKQAGLEVEILAVDTWKALPIARSSLAAEFRHLSDADLLVSGFDVILRKA